MSEIVTHHDHHMDVLYVRRSLDVPKTSREFSEDSYCILSYSAFGTITGVCILDAHALVPDWKDHPVRQILPTDILTALDIWFFSQPKLKTIPEVSVEIDSRNEKGNDK